MSWLGLCLQVVRNPMVEKPSKDGKPPTIEYHEEEILVGLALATLLQYRPGVSMLQHLMSIFLFALILPFLSQDTVYGAVLRQCYSMYKVSCRLQFCCPKSSWMDFNAMTWILMMECKIKMQHRTQEELPDLGWRVCSLINLVVLYWMGHMVQTYEVISSLSLSPSRCSSSMARLAERWKQEGWNCSFRSLKSSSTG